MPSERGSADYAVAALGAEAEACIRAAAEQLFREADAAPARGGIDYGNGLLLACSQMPPKQRTGLQARVYPNPAGGIPLQDSGELYQQAVQFEGIVAEQPQLKAPAAGAHWISASRAGSLPSSSSAANSWPGWQRGTLSMPAEL